MSLTTTIDRNIFFNARVPSPSIFSPFPKGNASFVDNKHAASPASHYQLEIAVDMPSQDARARSRSRRPRRLRIRSSLSPCRYTTSSSTTASCETSPTTTSASSHSRHGPAEWEALRVHVSIGEHMLGIDPPTSTFECRYWLVTQQTQAENVFLWHPMEATANGDIRSRAWRRNHVSLGSHSQ